MRKLTKMSAMLLASGLILTGCGGNKGLEEKNYSSNWKCNSFFYRLKSVVNVYTY